MNKDEDYTVGSENVFADLGIVEPDEALLKATLAQKISEIIEQEGWTQAHAAHLLGVDQPKISALMRGRLSGFSTDRLFRFLTAMGQNVEIIVTPKASSQAQGMIMVTSATEPSQP